MIRRRTIELSGVSGVVGGRTATPVARVTTTVVAVGPAGLVRQRIAPARIEVVDAEGRKRRVPVPDAGRRIRFGLSTLVGLVVAWRVRRVMRSLRGGNGD